MNSFIKIKRLASSAIGLKNPSPNIKIKLKYKKNSLSKILKDIKNIRYKNLDKISIFNNNNNFSLNKPKTSSRNFLKNYNDFSGSSGYDSESIFTKDINNIKVNQIKKPVWNYSYYFNEKDNNKKYYKIKCESAKKIRIKQLLNFKNPYIIEDWQKPRMIKILEKNSLIEEEIMLRPWKFFPNIDNY